MSSVFALVEQGRGAGALGVSQAQVRTGRAILQEKKMRVQSSSSTESCLLAPKRGKRASFALKCWESGTGARGEAVVYVGRGESDERRWRKQRYPSIIIVQLFGQ